MGIYKLENEYLEIKIADDGAELCSIYDKRSEREILWQADPKYWERHAPVLFPNVGKHYGGKYWYNGKSYAAKQHGFARDKNFTCTAKDGNSITHCLLPDDDTRKNFPFEFRLEITHTLLENKVHVGWRVCNEGDNEMYFTIGGHPAFRVPFLENTKQSDYKLLFRGKSSLEYILIDKESGTGDTGKKYKMELEENMCEITRDMFDHDALIFDDYQIEWAAIGYPDGKPHVAISAEGFSEFGIWSKPGAPFVCLEPWAGRCDNTGFNQDISEKPGIIKVKPAKKFEKGYYIIIY